MIPTYTYEELRTAMQDELQYPGPTKGVLNYSMNKVITSAHLAVLASAVQRIDRAREVVTTTEANEPTTAD